MWDKYTVFECSNLSLLSNSNTFLSNILLLQCDCVKVWNLFVFVNLQISFIKIIVYDHNFVNLFLINFFKKYIHFCFF